MMVWSKASFSTVPILAKGVATMRFGSILARAMAS